MHDAIKPVRVLLNFLALLASPVLLLAAFLALIAEDLAWFVFGHRRKPLDVRPRNRAASIVIPNWNGRDLLEKYLPSVLAAIAGNPGHELIVVDNGSTDGSADLVRERFPEVRLLALQKNLGFGGGSNAGFLAARNDIVVLLNSDMRVEPDFLQPLLEGFTDDRVFAISCQIFFSASGKKREETGLTQAAWHEGRLHVRHRIDPSITGLYPCFYGGGGSCAFDRLKFLELGGFDPLLAPFYLEDTDMGFLAWKRGWKVLYQPRSVVHHEHRGTIGRHFSRQHIEAAYNKNFALFSWKNIHEWRRLAAHFAFAFSEVIASALLGNAPARTNALILWRAFRQLPQALGSRWRARGLALDEVNDTEAFVRHLGGYYRDRFDDLDRLPPSEPVRVLFVSPYPICPPVHGGAVFMHGTVAELTRLCELHLIVLLERPEETAAHRNFAQLCASAEFLVRAGSSPKSFGSIMPHAVDEFRDEDLAWTIHRQIYTRKIDVIQLEYTALAQYAGGYRRVVNALFEHDIYFQSIRRALGEPRDFGWKLKAGFEYLRALRYELRVLPRMDHIQVCSLENKRHLESYLPQQASKIEEGLRAGIDVAGYNYTTEGREPLTMLFIGGFRHLPNKDAFYWFIESVLPRIRARQPRARLVVVGSELPPAHVFDATAGIELQGLALDIREPLSKYAVFVCPIRSGSGVRVKLLEAFAAGIPVVSTRIGAEGLAREDGEFCALADEPKAFADKVLELFENGPSVTEMTARARREIERNWDAAKLARKLLARYRTLVSEKRARCPKTGAATASLPRP